MAIAITSMPPPKKKNVFFILTLHKVNPFYENKYYQELL
ncbi:hypothetical protein ECDEC1E_4957 [Escherichia coli DEC1E]|nr:hypothetical protein ECDEC1E_4957 [Escherichia coli DEC1E]